MGEWWWWTTGGKQCFWLGTCKGIIFQPLLPICVVFLGVCSRRRAEVLWLSIYTRQWSSTAAGCQFAQLSGSVLVSEWHFRRLPDMWLQARWEGARTSRFPTKYSAVGCCSGLIISEVRLCSVPSPPLIAIGASITLISVHLRKRRKGRRSKSCIKWKNYAVSWILIEHAENQDKSQRQAEWKGKLTLCLTLIGENWAVFNW